MRARQAARAARLAGFDSAAGALERIAAQLVPALQREGVG